MSPKQKRVPTVLSSEELMDKALSRAAKITKNGTNALDTKKKTALARVTASGDVIISTLDKYVNEFPRLEKGEDFFPELIDLVVGLDRYKKALGAVNWASKRAEILKNETLRNIRWTKDPVQIDTIRKGFYGRLTSVIKRIGPDLQFLSDTKRTFRVLPDVDPDVPTAVIAGFPNVGKSRLVAALSTAEPEVAPYPFTTKGIVIGHLSQGWRSFQIIDTPGLLDRKLDERNAIELQAVLALKYLTDVLIFIIDPSETCGYVMEKQIALLESVKEGFPETPIIILESKADILKREAPMGLPFSVESGESMEEVRAMVTEGLRSVVKVESLE